MKYFVVFLQVLVFSFSITANASTPRDIRSANDSFVANMIEGTVYDPSRRPVPNVWVELQNDFNMGVGRMRTTTSGRFTFPNLRTGHYYIKVYATGTNYEDQTVSVDVVNVIQNSSDTVYQDVNLQFDKRKMNVGIQQMTDIVFAQDVPEQARRLYKSGLKSLGGKDFVRGADEIDQALKIFPDYYDALNALGCNYVDRKEYQRSLPYLIRAVDVNQRSFSSFYSLAYAAFKLDHLPEAGEAARAAVILQANSVNALLLYGTILRSSGSYGRALEPLLKAEKLSKESPVSEIHWQLAVLYNKLDRNSEAADQLEIYLRLRPDVADKKGIQEWIRKLRSKTT
jgi:tetratricopeptide (TPR) repeat protein